MRIIGGKYRGKSIVPPQGYKARPTTDFAKEGLFNILNNEYEMEGLKVPRGFLALAAMWVGRHLLLWGGLSTGLWRKI